MTDNRAGNTDLENYRKFLRFLWSDKSDAKLIEELDEKLDQDSIDLVDSSSPKL